MFDITDHRGIAVLAMRHGKANVMDLEFCEALAAQLQTLAQGPARAIVLTGQGRIFSAGVDLLRVLEGGDAYVGRFLPALCQLFDTAFALPKPLVAAVNGAAIAGGCVLACAADHRLIAQGEGRMGVPEVLVGVPFPTSAFEIMRFAAAPRSFAEVLYGGAVYAAAEALAHGLADAVVESPQLLERSLAAAEKLAALAPDAFAFTKRQLRAPVITRIREEGPAADREIRTLWARSEAQVSIRDYVARTFKRSAA